MRLVLHLPCSCDFVIKVFLKLWLNLCQEAGPVTWGRAGVWDCPLPHPCHCALGSQVQVAHDLRWSPRPGLKDPFLSCLVSALEADAVEPLWGLRLEGCC